MLLLWDAKSRSQVDISASRAGERRSQACDDSIMIMVSGLHTTNMKMRPSTDGILAEHRASAKASRLRSTGSGTEPSLSPYGRESVTDSSIRSEVFKRRLIVSSKVPRMVEDCGQSWLVYTGYE
jgi:hypothetical protein